MHGFWVSSLTHPVHLLDVGPAYAPGPLYPVHDDPEAVLHGGAVREPALRPKRAHRQVRLRPQVHQRPQAALVGLAEVHVRRKYTL